MAIKPNFNILKHSYYINRNGVPILKIIIDFFQDLSSADVDIVLDVNQAKETITPSLQGMKNVASNYRLKPFTHFKREVEKRAELSTISDLKKINLLQEGIKLIEKGALTSFEKDNLMFFLDQLAISVDTEGH